MDIASRVGGPGLGTQMLRREGAPSWGAGCPLRGRVAPGRDAAVASLQPRGLLARGGSPGPASIRESAGVTFLISVGISIVGEELSGATRPNSGRGDGCFLC